MSSPRFGCGAAQIAPSKLVIVVGGYNGTCWSTSAEIYDYETDTWSGVEPMPEPVEFCVFTTFGHNLVLVIGNSSSNSNAADADAIYCYSISQNKWKTIKSYIRYSLAGSTMASIDGKLVTIGGGSSEYGSTRVRLCTNLKRALHVNEQEDGTLSTTSPRSSVSFSHHDDSPHDAAAAAGEDTDDVPWWASPRIRTSKSIQQLIIPQEELDQVSLLDGGVLIIKTTLRRRRRPLFFLGRIRTIVLPARGGHCIPRRRRSAIAVNITTTERTRWSTTERPRTRKGTR
jgi:hypothetical protein